MPTNEKFDHSDLIEAKVAIATLEVQFSNMSAQMAELKQSLVQVTAKLDAVNTTLNEARGGWRTLMMMGGAAGAIGSVLTWAAQHIKA